MTPVSRADEREEHGETERWWAPKALTCAEGPDLHGVGFAIPGT